MEASGNAWLKNQSLSVQGKILGVKVREEWKAGRAGLMEKARNFEIWGIKESRLFRVLERRKKNTPDFSGFKVLMKMMEKRGTEIIYVVGNHDDFLDSLAPFKFSNISIVKDYLLKTRQGKRYFVTHGDIFDTVTTHMRWLAMLGDVGYTFLLWLNKVYNHRRERQGKPYFSLSQEVKHRVKSAVSYISEFEKELVRLAEAKHLDGIICGHIHQAASVWYGNVHYLNSGDWVESMTALVEDEQGEWDIVTYNNVQLYADAV